MGPGKDIEKELEDTMESINGMSRAAMPAFFYTRLAARMDRPPVGVRGLFTRPALSLAALVLLLVLNISAIAHYVKTNSEKVEETGGLQSLAGEMTRDLSSVYDKTNN